MRIDIIFVPVLLDARVSYCISRFVHKLLFVAGAAPMADLHGCWSSDVTGLEPPRVPTGAVVDVSDQLEQRTDGVQVLF
jgi:hypothetical protein